MTKESIQNRLRTHAEWLRRRRGAALTDSEISDLDEAANLIDEWEKACAKMSGHEPKAECPHCREVYEIWANTEGFTPVTAPEGYQQHVIEQMREAAARGLKAEPGDDPNPLDPTNNQFRLCPNGHVPYSRSFDGCPSCKVVAMRAAQSLNREAES